MTHSYQAALKASKKYFSGNELAAKVFVDKYALRNANKELLELTPADMFRRVARELSRIEAKKFAQPFSEDEIFSWMDHFKYIIPQGGCLYGIGNTHQYVTLSNCYVIEPPVDSYGGIHYTDEQITQISKRRGGTGTCLDNLRPCGSPTRNSSRSSTGPVSFAKRYSHSIREVGQDGRRGALMLMLSVHHPDVLDFVKSKLDLHEITGANISIKITDAFMQAVEAFAEYELRYPIEGIAKQSTMFNARAIWEYIIHYAWKSGEPGVLFWDTIIRESVADCYAQFGYRTVATNPCSELPLCVLDSCRLLLLNLFSFVVNPFTPEAYFDFNLFFKMAGIAQRIMDDIIDLELECIDRIIAKIQADPEQEKYKARELELWQTVREKCFNGRRTGTGVTGLGDVFAALGFAYGSDKAMEYTDAIFKTLKFACYTSSVEMAKELGPFPVWNHELEKDNPFLNRMREEAIKFYSKDIINGDNDCELPDAILLGDWLYDNMAKYGRRNIACLTCAPAGSMGVVCQTTSGFEPLFFKSYKRRKKGNPGDEEFRIDFVDATGDSWMEFEEVHPRLKQWMQVTGETDITKSPWHGCCAEDLDYIKRIKMQGIAQKHIDHAISSTINLPANITEAEVAKIYELAWRVGCKGITVYRKGARDGVILDSSLDSEKNDGKINKRPREVACDVHHITVKGQQYFVLVGLIDGKPYEVFAGKNGFIPKKIKSGKIVRKRANFYIAKFDDTDIEISPITASCTELEEVISRLISLSLRSGANMHRIVQQAEKVGERYHDLQGFCRGLVRALKKYIPDGTAEEEKCSECGAPLIRQDGCIKCSSCGWSKCL